MARGLQASGDVVEDCDCNDALGVLASAAVGVGGGHAQDEGAQGHGAGDEEEGGCQGHEAPGFRAGFVELQVCVVKKWIRCGQKEKGRESGLQEGQGRYDGVYEE